jgi:hypothetical protein
MSYRNFLLLLAALGFCPSAHAWSVVRKGDSAAGPFVVVDAGADDGITKTSRLCILDADGEDIACGDVISLRATASGVRLSAEQQALVPVGALVRLDGEDERLPGASGVWRSRLSLRLVSPLAQPVVYDAVRFNDQARSNVALPTWVKVATVESGAWGFNGSWEKPIGEALALSPGVFMSVNNDVDNRSQLVPASDRILISALTKGGHWGLKCDLDWKAFAAFDFLLQMGGGLAFLDSTANVEVKYFGRSSSLTIATYESRLLALALEGDIELHYGFGDLALFAGFRLSLPLAKLDDGYEGAVDFDSVDLGDARYDVDALGEAVAHRTAIGRGLELGASYAF